MNRRVITRVAIGLSLVAGGFVYLAWARVRGLANITHPDCHLGYCGQQQPVVTPSNAGGPALDSAVMDRSNPTAERARLAPIEEHSRPVASASTAEFADRPSNDVTFAGLTREESDAFLARLKRALESDDRAAVAAMISYPTELRLNGKGPLILIHTPSQFVSNYQAIVTERVRSELRAATPETVHANWQGVSTSRGAVWFNGVCKESRCKRYEILVTRINNHAVPGEPPR